MACQHVTAAPTISKQMSTTRGATNCSPAPSASSTQRVAIGLMSSMAAAAAPRTNANASFPRCGRAKLQRIAVLDGGRDPVDPECSIIVLDIPLIRT